LFVTQIVVLAMAVGPVLGVQPARAVAGGVLQTGAASAPPGVILPAFLFEPEFPLTSLKQVPTWNEIEQMLDNPYALALDPATPGNDQGFPSYRTTINRRPAFGVTLPQLLVHPLNYNPNIGEEMRLLNPDFAGAAWQVPEELVQDPVNPTRFNWIYKTVTVSPGAGRVDETAIDYNSPHKPDSNVCIASTEAFPVPEGSTVCGGDPGEPGYAGFAALLANSASQYSVPAVPGSTKASTLGGSSAIRSGATSRRATS
jgi:hypothetical protein